MSDFETLLESCKPAAERYVRFKISDFSDADDILQEIYLSAFRNFPTLHDTVNFKAWLIGIAKRKCSDYYRAKYRTETVSLEETPESELPGRSSGNDERFVVRYIVDSLQKNDREIIYLYYFYGLSQPEIAERYKIPIGTVKSRLRTAKEHFRSAYTDPADRAKGVIMSRLPEILPNYIIQRSSKPPFAVRLEEMPGWFIVPRPGEKIKWAAYDLPARKCAERVEMEVTGEAEIHGISGVEILSKQYDETDNAHYTERRFIAQLTDTHCRILAESHMKDGVRKTYTFLDGDDFLKNWGVGKDNCGNAVDISPKGVMTRSGSDITCSGASGQLDIIGRYSVTINGKTYDTVCIMDAEYYDSGTVNEQYVDKNGRTVLWRRFNHNKWHFERYGKMWTELLPENECITVNGNVYVHWYDCVTDHIL